MGLAGDLEAEDQIRCEGAEAIPPSGEPNDAERSEAAWRARRVVAGSYRATLGILTGKPVRLGRNHEIDRRRSLAQVDKGYRKTFGRSLVQVRFSGRRWAHVDNSASEGRRLETEPNRRKGASGRMGWLILGKAAVVFRRFAKPVPPASGRRGERRRQKGFRQAKRAWERGSGAGDD